MYNYGKYPASVGGKLVLFPNGSNVLFTDPACTMKCTRQELEDNIGSTLICVDTTNKIYAVPVKIAVHTTANAADTVTVLTLTESEQTVTIASTAYTVKED